MQVGGERLGRVGIAVAGQERRAMARFGVARRRLAGMERPVEVWPDKLRQGVWRVAARWGLWRHGRHGGVRHGGGRCEMARFGRNGVGAAVGTVLD